MSDMPMIIWVKPKCSSYYTARSVVDADIPNNKFVVAEESELDKYHHDSILQAKDREIAELNTRIATLEKQLEGKIHDC